MKLLVKIALGLVIVFVAIRLADKRQTFDVTARNTGAEKIESLEVTFEGFAFRFGSIQTRTQSELGSAVYSAHYSRWPTELNAKWIEPGVIPKKYAQTLSIRPAMKSSSDHKLELTIEIQNGRACAYPRLFSRPFNYKYDQSPPCEFTSLPPASQVK